MKRFVAVVIVLILMFSLVACAAETQDNRHRHINDNFTVVSKFGDVSGYPAFLVYDNNTFVMYIVTIGSGVSFCPYYESNGNVAIYEGRGY
jgi:protein-disulfide isomerase-like protein with CxxC motif